MVGRLPRIRGKVLDLARDNCETAAVLTGTCGFNRGIKRKEVDLPRNLIDHLDDVVDLLYLLVEILNLLDALGRNVLNGLHLHIRVISEDLSLTAHSRHVLGILEDALRSCGNLLVGR